MEKKHYDVLILGGGFAGLSIAKQIEHTKNVRVALVNRNDYFTYTPSLHKLVIEPSYFKKIAVPFSQVLKQTEVITDEIISIKPEKIKTRKKEISFSYLVISIGVSYPIFLQNQKNVFAMHSADSAIEMHKALEKNKSVAVIGGGLIGVEIAAELATKTDKIITVIDPSPLLSRNVRRAGQLAKNFLEKRNVTVITGERVISRRKDEIVTDKQTSIQAGLVVWCGGVAANSSIIGGGFAQSKDERGFLLVNEHLRLKNFNNVFVAGDLAALPEEKTAQNAQKHARIVAANLKLLLSGKNPGRTYCPGKIPLLISLGERNGIFCYGSFAFSGVIPAIIKRIVEMRELWNINI